MHGKYLFKNPYRISRKRGYLYGETPLTTMDKIACHCQILSKDILFDLGCGRARSLFWLSHFVQCQTVGIDICGEFIRNAEWVRSKAGLENMSFQEGDFFDINYQKATVIYIYGTSFSEEIIKSLIEKLRSLSSETKIITVSFALNEYCESLFEVKKEFIAAFPWGNATVYLQSPRLKF